MTALDELKDYMEKNGLTQADFADLAQVHRVDINRVLNESRPPSKRVALAIEGLTGIAMSRWFESPVILSNQKAGAA